MGKKINKANKILVIIYLTLVMLGVFLPDSFVIGIHRLPEGIRLDSFQMIIRWLNYSSFVILPIAAIYDRNIFKKVAIYFCLPIGIIYMCLFGQMIECFTSSSGTGIVDIRYLPEFISLIMRNGIFRGIIFFVTCLVEFTIIALLIIKDYSFLKFKKNEIIPFIVLLICSILTIMPVYALEGIFNTYTDFIFYRFSFLHIMWIIILIAEAVLLTIMFRKKSEEDRYILVLILALSLFLQFNQLFSSLGELTCKRMPLQLCNIAAYVILLSIVTKKRNLFLFNILINVAGGLIALFVLDAETDLGILSKGNVHYIVEHHNVILVPILCLTLGVFKPITMKDFKSFVTNFSLYYIVIFIIGTLFNALYVHTGSDYFYCNYLFMFDQETAARLIPFAGKMFDIKFNIGPATIYPLIQPLIYIAFFAIGTAAFFIFKAAIKEKKVSEI